MKSNRKMVRPLAAGLGILLKLIADIRSSVMSGGKKSPRSPPWQSWIPGVLSKTQVRKLIENHYISGAEEGLLDNSSLDLRLSKDAYVMRQGSVKPSGEGYLCGLKKQNLAEELKPQSNGTFLLESRKTYLFRLQESIGKLKDSGLYGQATAKSSVGRVDVLARLIVDGMDVYESFDHANLTESGDMYVELTPMTFRVVVKSDIPLVQLRFFRGRPRRSEVRGTELYESVLTGSAKQDGSLSVDLSTASEAKGQGCAFRAKQNTNDSPIKLWVDEEKQGADPGSYWEVEKADRNKRLVIEKNVFYIMRSIEKIRLPAGVAVYCRATDETIGEMRIHYAGFAHPYFGYKTNSEYEETGTPLIFEVRGHDVNVTLGHGEKMANLIFYRMSKDCTKADYEESNKFYNDQTLQLSKFFAEW